MNLYLLMAVTYLSLAALAAIDSAFTSFNLLPWFTGLRWLRVHLITLGAIVQLVFGLLPALVARQTGRPRSATRPERWLALNAGLLLLVIGIPIVDGTLIVAGGTLIFIATLLLLRELASLRSERRQERGAAAAGRSFYLAGLGFFLIGILAGTGLWLGWGEALRMARPKEVHLHANIWGLTALVFAGLLVDLYPRFAGRPLAWPRSLRPIFWMMVSASLLLLLAPWTGENRLTAPGMILMLLSTSWLLLNLIVPLLRVRAAWSQPGIWHLLSAYYWVLTPVFAAPVVMIIGGRAALPFAAIEQDAPQWLVYSWLLHFAYALLPYSFQRLFRPDEPAALGGSWFSLVAVHLGSIFFWAGILSEDARAPLQGIGYLLWGASMVPVLIDLWRIASARLARLATGGEQPPLL